MVILWRHEEAYGTSSCGTKLASQTHLQLGARSHTHQKQVGQKIELLNFTPDVENKDVQSKLVGFYNWQTPTPKTPKGSQLLNETFYSIYNILLEIYCETLQLL